MSLELVTEKELKGSGYNLRGQVGPAYKFQNGSNFLYADKEDNKYNIKAWYYENEKVFKVQGVTGIQRRMYDE